MSMHGSNSRSNNQIYLIAMTSSEKVITLDISEKRVYGKESLHLMFFFKVGKKN